MQSFDALIVGGGHAGAQAAIGLRQNGYKGTIGIVGDEPEYPYERPPLSKDYLAGEKPFQRMLIRPPDFWRERDVAMLLGRRAVKVSPGGHEVALDDGTRLRYGTLVWAAGGRARQLSCAGGDLARVHSVRSRGDGDRMMAELATTGRVAIIGAGYIGLEAAAVLTKLGKKVVLLEAMDRVLARVAGEPVSRFYEAEHRAHGVDLRTGVVIDCIDDDGGIASGVRLQGGEFIPAEMVIVGIGIVPAVEPLIETGAAGGNGVDVDAYCRTSLADVFAIGDCAAHENRFAGGARIRIESVQNANDQAMAVAKTISSEPTDYDAVPWFWSNQYELRLQTVGISAGHDDFVVRGDPRTRSFSTVYLREGRVIALDCINATKDYVQGRKLVVSGASPRKAALADTATALKDLLP